MRGDPQCCQGVFGFSRRRPARAFSSATQCVSRPGAKRASGDPSAGLLAGRRTGSCHGRCHRRRLPSRYGSANPRQSQGIDPSPAGSAGAGTRLAFASAVARLDGPGSGRCGRSWRAWPWRCSRGRAEGSPRARRPRRSPASRSLRCSPPSGRLRWRGRAPPIARGARRRSTPSCRSPRPRPWPASTCGSTAGREPPLPYSQHDSPADGFTLVGGQPATVGFHQAAIECAPPFTIDRIDARVRSGDTLVYQGSWSVSLSFVE